jgi:hypothetical protein
MYNTNGFHISMLYNTTVGLNWGMPYFTGVSWDWFVSMQKRASVFYNRKFLYSITG